MEKSTIFIILLFVVVLAIRLYSKYARKGAGKTGSNSQDNKAGQSKSGEDDYEPYLKK